MDRVKLFFIEGNISGAESKRRVDDNRLGKILLKKGLIKEEELQTALAEHKKTGDRLGNILVSREIVPKETVSEIVHSQITETVIQLFSWKEGSYEFKSERVTKDKELSFSLDTQHLLMEGLRIVDEWSMIKGKISLDMVFARKEEAPGELSAEEETVLRYVDGENDVSTVIDLSGMDNFEVSKTLLILMEKGIIATTEVLPVAAKVEVGETKRPMPFLGILVPAAVCVALVLSLLVMAAGNNGLSRHFNAAGTIEDLRYRIETYKIEHSTYPASLDLVSHSKDPWGRPYDYKVSNGFFYLRSAGPDGQYGTADDVY
jgi:hypothetical protein